MAISKKKQLEDLTSRVLNLDPDIRIEKSEITASGEISHRMVVVGSLITESGRIYNPA